MQESAKSNRSVTMMGSPLTLAGTEVKVGEKAPDFVAVDNALQPARLSSYAGKVVILSAVPSLDTPVCSLQTRRFNNEAVGLGPQVRVLTLSMDLPFAQKRWCANEGLEAALTLSDHRDASFGQAYGVLIQELRLLARAVFVVDASGTLCYRQLVPELTQEPDYNEVLKAVRAALG